MSAAHVASPSDIYDCLLLDISPPKSGRTQRCEKTQRRRYIREWEEEPKPVVRFECAASLIANVYPESSAQWVGERARKIFFFEWLSVRYARRLSLACDFSTHTRIYPPAHNNSLETAWNLGVRAERVWPQASDIYCIRFDGLIKCV